MDIETELLLLIDFYFASYYGIYCWTVYFEMIIKMVMTIHLVHRRHVLLSGQP